MRVTRREIFQFACMAAGGLAIGARSPLANETKQVTVLTRGELAKDAEVAWRFFSAERRGIRKGLVPAAAWPQDGTYGTYDILTMWDTGSIILAYIAARSIGLIEAKEFDERISTVLAFLQNSEFRFGKLVLPNYRNNIIDTSSAEAGYDATDTGRLLVALHILEKTTGGAYGISKLMARWNFSEIVSEGVLYDIKDASRLKSECYNYIYYISRAQKLWGIDIATGYEAAIRADDDASRNSFVAHVAKVGAIAAEPNLNEAIELGHSTASRILSETLSAAQRQRFELTGQLTCVSEAPIDKNPWFTYQGFDVNAEGWARWPVHSVVTANRWSTKSFADKYRMVNTKAAYMWLTEGQDAYTLQLRKHILANARTDTRGFSPGVYEASNKRPNIVDVNTNATVLQSVAFLLAGSKPLQELKL